MRYSLALLVLLAAGCDTAEPDPGPVPAIPLAVGAEWSFAQTYLVRFDDGVPVDTLAAPAEARTHTLRATRDTLISDETWVLIQSVSDGPALGHCVFGRPAWFTNRADGLYRWTESPADAELVYGVGVAPGVPFLDTDVVSAVLIDADGLVEGVPARVYERTWRRLEFNAETRGPIDPTARTVDALSPTEGPLALEIQYVTGDGAPGSFVPSSTVGFARVDL